MHIDLPNGHSIKTVDSRNICLYKAREIKRKNGEIIVRQEEMGCYSNLEDVLSFAIREMALTAKDIPEALKLIRQMRKLTKEIYDTSRDSKN